MSRDLSAEQTRARRMRAQRLTGPGERTVVAVVGALCAIQAQDLSAAGLAIRARSEGLVAAAVDHACWTERSLVRTWALRGTLHVLRSDDIGWIIGLLGPMLARAGRPRRLALKLDDELCERALVALRAILSDEGPLTRAELVRRLGAAGVTIDPDGQAPAHLILLAALRGVVCHGPATTAAKSTYALLEDWIEPLPDVVPDWALAELTRRYLSGHGPAAPQDLARWSGLGLRDARRGFERIAGDLTSVQADGASAWLLRSDRPAREPDAPHVRLLGHFDPYLLGYRDRALVLDARHASRIQAGGGFIQPALLVGGRVTGTWRRRRTRDGLVIEPQPFEPPLAEDVVARIDDEAADVARFLGLARPSPDLGQSPPM